MDAVPEAADRAGRAGRHLRWLRHSDSGLRDSVADEGVARGARGIRVRCWRSGWRGWRPGSPFAGYCGDRFGRRPALIGCVALFGLATVATAFVHGARPGWRYSDSSPAWARAAHCRMPARWPPSSRPLRRRPVAVKLTIVCVPLGGMLGGVIAARVLPALGLARAVPDRRRAAAGCSRSCCGRLLPESPRFLAQRPAAMAGAGPTAAAHGPRRSGGQQRSKIGRSASGDRAPVRERCSVPALARDTVGLVDRFLFLSGFHLPGVRLASGHVDLAGTRRCHPPVAGWPSTISAACWACCCGPC